jgi:hypothetical protein
MGSFKLEKGGSTKKQTTSVGGLLIILGLFGGFIIHPFGFALTGLGVLLALAGTFASE